MNRISFAVALLAFSLTSPGHAKEAPSSFQHEGVTYSYTVTNVSDTRRVIQGYASPGTPFRLVVSRGRVSGTANGSAVEFTMKDVKLITASATVAPLAIAAR